MLSRHRFPATIVYAALSGEEQGLVGGKILADYARAQGWQVDRQSQQRHHRQQLRLGRRLRRRPCPGLLGRAALAGRRRARAPQVAASAARTIRRRATSRASSTRWPTISASASTSARSGATTASAAAATIPSSSTPASRRCASRSRSRITTGSTRTCGPRTGIVYGDTIDRMDFPYLRQVTAAQRRRAGRAGARADAAGAEVEGAVSTDTTLDWRAGAGRRRLCRPLAAHRLPPIGSTACECRTIADRRAAESRRRRHARAAGSRRTFCRASASTTGCSASRRSRRTARRARLHPRCRAARSGPTRRRRRRQQ